MSVPHRDEAVRLLLALEPPAWLVRHSAAVTEVSTFLAQRIAARGTSVDVSVVEAAGLLHDLDKALPGEHSLRALGHGAAGAEWLRRNGHPELASAVAHHPATLLSDEERYRRWAAGAPVEERIVAYADKRAEQDVVTLEQRFASWRQRHPEHAGQLQLALSRARLLEQEVCGLADLDPAEIERVPWFEELAERAVSSSAGR